MPRYDFVCPSGHTTEILYQSWRQAKAMEPCETCGSQAMRIISIANPALYFEEGGGGRMIENLGHEPVMVTSAKQHKDLMKQAGVTWASKDDMLHQQTRRALDAKRPDPHSIKETFRKIRETV